MRWHDRQAYCLRAFTTNLGTEMSTSVTRFVIGSAISAVLLTSATASAGGFKFGGGSSGNKGGGNGSSGNNNHNGGNNSSPRIKFGGLGTPNNHSSHKDNSSSKPNGNSSSFDKKKKGSFEALFGKGNNDVVKNQLIKSFDKNHNHGNYNNGHHNDYCDDYNRPRVRVYCAQPVNDSYYPYFSSCSVYPGDTYRSLSLRAYGMSNFGNKIATYNRLGSSTQLTTGQTLQFPVIHADGRLTKSNALAHVPFATQTDRLGSNNIQLAKATTSTRTSTTSPTPTIDPTIPSVAVGSTLLVEGQAFGPEKGTVKLHFGNVSLPVEIIEWTATAAKVQLPKLDVSAPTTADLEITLANGTLATKSTLRLSPGTNQVVLNK